MAARFTTRVRIRSVDGIESLNPAEGIPVRLLCSLCVVQVMVSKTGGLGSSLANALQNKILRK